MKNGFDEVSIKQIQEESGIAIGTIYYHFKDKNEILTYMINRYIVEDFYMMKKELLNLNVSFMEKLDFNLKYTMQSYNTQKEESEDISKEDPIDYRDYWTLYTNIYHHHPETKHIFLLSFIIDIAIFDV
jgi:AcrR family transcriptional regulator